MLLYVNCDASQNKPHSCSHNFWLSKVFSNILQKCFPAVSVSIKGRRGLPRQIAARVTKQNGPVQVDQGTVAALGEPGTTSACQLDAQFGDASLDSLRKRKKLKAKTKANTRMRRGCYL